MVERAREAFYAPNATALAIGQGPAVVALSARLRRTLDAAVRRALPNEVCLLLGGVQRGERAELLHVLRLPNRARARDRFDCCPVRFLRLQRALARRDRAILGFAHSHPYGTPHPSAIDRGELWRQHLQLIAAPQRGGDVELAAWFAPVDGGFRRVPIAIEPTATGTTEQWQ